MRKDKQNVFQTVCEILFKADIGKDEFASYLGINSNKRLIKEHVAMEYLGICQSSFQEFVKTGEIHKIEMGPKTIRYDMNNLNDFILKHRCVHAS